MDTLPIVLNSRNIHEVAECIQETLKGRHYSVRVSFLDDISRGYTTYNRFMKEVQVYSPTSMSSGFITVIEELRGFDLRVHSIGGDSPRFTFCDGGIRIEFPRWGFHYPQWKYAWEPEKPVIWDIKTAEKRDFSDLGRLGAIVSPVVKTHSWCGILGTSDPADPQLVIGLEEKRLEETVPPHTNFLIDPDSYFRPDHPLLIRAKYVRDELGFPVDRP